MSAFSFDVESIALPKGAVAQGLRRTLRWRDQAVLSVTQGAFRPYLYPLYSPAGFAVLSESPADHPHHNGIWVAADHLNCRMPLAGGAFEEATYCFYVNETFQGRAPGRIEERGCVGDELEDGRYRVRQDLAWRGPREWGAPEGRVIAVEERVVDVRCGETHHIVDVASTLSPTDWDFTLGPTRHAYFGVRVAESMRVNEGGRLTGANGGSGEAAVSGTDTPWVDYTGPVARDARAGVTVIPGADTGAFEWFATDWGTIALNPCRHAARLLRIGERLTLAMRVVVHDGDANVDVIQRWANE